MKEFRSSIAVKKGMHTLFLLFIYVLGSRLALPFVDLNSRDFLGGSAAYLDFSVALTGGNLFHWAFTLDVSHDLVADVFLFKETGLKLGVFRSPG